MAFFPCNSGSPEKFTYCLSAVYSDNSTDVCNPCIVYNPDYHNRVIYTHTGSSQWTTKSIDLETQLVTTYPHAADGRYGYSVSFVPPSVMRCFNHYPGLVFMIAFKEGDGVEVIAENQMPGYSSSVSINCNGYRAAWLNFGGQTPWGANIVCFIDIENYTVYRMLGYAYSNWLSVSLSGRALNLASNDFQPYYSLIGIR